MSLLAFFMLYLQINDKSKKMFEKFKKSEILILVLVIVLIFTSEYFYIILKDPQRAIFIGLWPPTILGLLIFLNLKLKK